LLVGGCVTRERVVYRQRGGRVVRTETITTAAPVGSEIIVREAPPAPIVETVVVSPGPGFVWVSGGWMWHDRWVWERGHWDRPPRVGVVWVPHRYVYRGGVHVFVRGGWR
jgi:hypothetical protein